MHLQSNINLMLINKAQRETFYHEKPQAKKAQFVMLMQVPKGTVSVESELTRNVPLCIDFLKVKIKTSNN